MNDNQPNDSIQQAVLDKVRAGKVHRRPRSYFIMRIAATVVVSILLLITSALVISFILFSLDESGEQFLLGFGLHGIEVFFILFPWVPTLLTIALLFLLEWLLQGFKFGYRIPLLNIFLGIVGASLILGVLINFTPLHTTLLGFADKNELPIIGDVYEHILDSHEGQGVCRGMVVSVGQDSFTMYHNDHDQDQDDGTFIVKISPSSGLTLPHVGDDVLVFGDPEPGGCIEAEHIQMLPPGSL
jgi:hypothetical protein